MHGAAVEPEAGAWTEEGDQPPREEHFRGAPATRGQLQDGRVEEAPEHRMPRTPSRQHRSGPGPNPNFLGEVMLAASAAVEVAVGAAAVQREVGDDACVVEGAVVEHGADVMAMRVK